MRETEIVARLNQIRDKKHCFVKWWRTEEDFLDYDLIDRFVQNASGRQEVGGQEIGGFDLLTMDQMWQEVQRVGGQRVKLLHYNTGDKVEWVHRDRTGTRTEIRDYTPETLISIFDEETDDTVID